MKRKHVVIMILTIMMAIPISYGNSVGLERFSQETDVIAVTPEGNNRTLVTEISAPDDTYDEAVVNYTLILTTEDDISSELLEEAEWIDTTVEEAEVLSVNYSTLAGQNALLVVRVFMENVSMEDLPYASSTGTDVWIEQYFWIDNSDVELLVESYLIQFEDYIYWFIGIMAGIMVVGFIVLIATRSRKRTEVIYVPF